ncbi:hypothetical protein CHU98_g71 [Xylaria longipes]|nr:hypothetical protein CHU98_g71 [Xylaria longipes]
MSAKKSTIRTPLPSLAASQDAQGNKDTKSQIEPENNNEPCSNELPFPPTEGMPPGNRPKDQEHSTRPNHEQALKAVRGLLLFVEHQNDQRPNGNGRVNNKCPSPACNNLNSKGMKRAAADNDVEHTPKSKKSRRAKKPIIPPTSHEEPNINDAEAVLPETEAKRHVFALHPSITQGMGLLPHPLLQSPSQSVFLV